MPNETLTSARLVLRLARASDIEAYAAYLASDRARFVGGPFSRGQAFEKLCGLRGHWDLRGFGRYVLEYEGRGIGHVGPMQLDASVTPEMTWTLWDGALEGQGFASEAARAVLDHLMGDCGWDGLIARILPDNAASLRMAAQLGARLSDEPAPEWYAGALTYRFDQKVLA